MIKQYWSHVLFYNFKVAPQVLQRFVPFTLDIFEGSAYVSIVPFKMSNIELKIAPKVRYPKPLWELNLRTYVKVNGVAGVYFLTLDASSLLAVLGAQVCFSLPYRIATCDFQIDSLHQTYSFNHQRQLDKGISFQTQYQIGEIKSKTSLDLWITERYSLFTKSYYTNKTLRGIVHHKPWLLREVNVLSLNDNLSKMIDLKYTREQIESPGYCSGLQTYFSPFKVIDL